MPAIYPGLDISNKVCLVTGGTSGIGRAIAIGFAQAGAKVVAGSTNPEKVAAMKADLAKMGDNDCLAINIADPASVKSAVDSVTKKYGRIDAVVNAAGVTKRMPALDFPLDEWERILKINLTGNFILAQAVARVMKDQTPDQRGIRGAMVNIASLSSFVGLEGVTAYSVSKAGVMALTKNLANDWAQYGIRVNAIAPGVFPTDLNRSLIEGTPRGDWFKKHTPMARFGDAQELVGAAIYLISPSASFTTGETLIVDGGFLAKGV